MTNEKAIEVIKENCYRMNPLDLDGTVQINKALDKAVDALKRRAGNWIIVEEDVEWFEGIKGTVIQCVNCKFIHTIPHGSKIYDFCPKCGRQMGVILMVRNKDLCRKCIYHGKIGHSREAEKQEVCCMYSTKAYQSAIARDGSDKRGNDPNKCDLFEEGDPARVNPKGKAQYKEVKTDGRQRIHQSDEIPD